MKEVKKQIRAKLNELLKDQSECFESKYNSRWSRYYEKYLNIGSPRDIKTDEWHELEKQIKLLRWVLRLM